MNKTLIGLTSVLLGATLLHAEPKVQEKQEFKPDISVSTSVRDKGLGTYGYTLQGKPNFEVGAKVSQGPWYASANQDFLLENGKHYSTLVAAGRTFKLPKGINAVVEIDRFDIPGFDRFTELYAGITKEVGPVTVGVETSKSDRNSKEMFVAANITKSWELHGKAQLSLREGFGYAPDYYFGVDGRAALTSVLALNVPVSKNVDLKAHIHHNQPYESGNGLDQETGFGITLNHKF